MLSLRLLHSTRYRLLSSSNLVSKGRNSIRSFSSSDGENSSNNVSGKGDAMAEFLASRQAFMKSRQKDQYLQSHAKGPGGRSGQKSGSFEGKPSFNQENGRRQGGGRPGQFEGKQGQYREHRPHFRKGKTFQKSQHVRGGGVRQDGFIPTRKGGRGRVNRDKHPSGNVAPFDQGFLSTMDADGKNIERDWAEEIFYPDMLEVDEVDRWLQQGGQEQQALLAPESLNSAVPLKIEKDTFEDFLLANLMHPTKYAEVSNEGWHIHPESRREAEPITVSLKQPKLSFLRKWKSFIHVENIDLPPQIVGDEREDLIKQKLSRFCKFPERNIFPSSPNSAFVGFVDEAKCKNAIEKHHLKMQGASVEVKKYVPTIGSNQGDEYIAAFQDFINGAANGSSFLQVRNLPLKNNNWVQNRLCVIFNKSLGISSEDVFMKNEDTALIRVKDASLAANILQSSFTEKLEAMLGCFRDAKLLKVCHSTLELQQRFIGPGKRLCYLPGRRLIIDGSVPKDDFYISHAGVICLDSVPPTSKEDISRLFDKYCTDRRDILGSIQIVTCAKGIPTGRVFVGFDRDDDFEAALSDLEMNSLLVAGKKVKVRPVHDKTKRMPSIEKLGSRNNRQTEELFIDLSDWEQHIDPEVLNTLDQMYGKEMLEQVFTHLRMKNMSFGAIDQARSGERLEPHLEPGARKKEFISYYADMLLELYTTPENPGLLIESMFLEGEEIDLEAFDGPRKYVKSNRSTVE